MALGLFITWLFYFQEYYSQGRSKGRAAGAATLSEKYRGADLVINEALNLFLSNKRVPFITNTCKKSKNFFPLRGIGAPISFSARR